MWQSAELMLAGVDHQPVILPGQGGVDPAGLAGGHEQRLAQRRTSTQAVTVLAALRG